MLPFIHAEGLWEDIKMGGATCRAESIRCRKPAAGGGRQPVVSGDC